MQHTIAVHYKTSKRKEKSTGIVQRTARKIRNVWRSRQTELKKTSRLTDGTWANVRRGSGKDEKKNRGIRLGHNKESSERFPNDRPMLGFQKNAKY